MMVREIMMGNGRYFICEECCLNYKNKKLSEKCEAWCKKHNSCNLKITCYSLERKGGEK